MTPSSLREENSFRTVSGGQGDRCLGLQRWGDGRGPREMEGEWRAREGCQKWCWGTEYSTKEQQGLRTCGSTEEGRSSLFLELKAGRGRDFVLMWAGGDGVSAKSSKSVSATGGRWESSFPRRTNAVVWDLTLRRRAGVMGAFRG